MMSTYNPHAVTNIDEPQSSGDYEAFREKIAELTQDSSVQKTFTTSVDAATQGAAQAKINDAAQLLPDGWMSGPLGIDDLAAQVEAGRLMNSATLQKLAGPATSFGISAYNIYMAPEGQHWDQVQKEAVSQGIGIASGVVTSAALVAVGATSAPGIALGAVLAGAVSYAIESKWSEAIESGLDSVGDWLVDQKDSIVASVEERIGEFNDLLNDKLVEWDPLGLMPDADDLPTFDQAERMGSPIAIDLDGDGLETLSREDGVHFDHDGNGLAEKSGWVAADDGLLVRDLNDNDQIDGGRELFGDQTRLSDGSRAANGFEALAELDSNGDGRVDAEEADQQGIRIWQDANGDGKAQADELLSFAEAGLASVAVDYRDVTETDGQGNDIRQRGEVVTESGETRDAADIWFSVDPQDTQALDDLPLSDTVAALPDVPVFGNVLDLRQAMMRDATLESLVQQFINADSDAARQALLEPLIYQWTGAADTDPNSRDEYGSVYMDARKVVALEALVGRGYDSGLGGNYVQGPQAASILEAQFARFESYVKGQLMMRGEFREVFDTLTPTVEFENDSLHLALDTDAFTAALRERIDAGQGDEVVDILKTLRGADNYSEPLRGVAADLSADDVLATWLTRATTTGTDSDDAIEGTQGSDWLDGREGDDRLEGGAGDDTYHYDLGDGSDILYDTGGQDTLEFGAGIAPDDLTVTRDATTLFLDLPDGAGGMSTLRLDRVFDFDGNLRDTAIERFTFADGSTLTVGQLIERIDQSATEADDQFYGFGGDDIFNGLDGDDWIGGGAGNDTLYGGKGDDTLQGAAGDDDLQGGLGADVLQGGEGDDRLEGGAGNDTLYGGEGSDTYRFEQGWGSDRIQDRGDYYDYQSATDVIAFGEGIAPSEIVASRSGDDLILTRTGSDDRIEVDYYFRDDGDSRYAVETIRFADSTDWSMADVKTKVQVASEGDDELYGYDIDETLNGLGGDDLIRGHGGNDDLQGGAGDDTLYGGDGADQLTGDDGADRLYGNDGNDRLQGGLGDDRLYGNDGDDVLEGDAGDDTLSGGEGSDTYRFEQGWGSDRIQDRGQYRDYQAATDVIAFGKGIAPSEIMASRSGDDLILTRTGSDDRIEVDYYFRDDGDSRYAIETIRFADGTEWSMADVKTKVQVASEGDDELYGYDIDETLNGLGGDDLIRGHGGNDDLQGGLGDDRLYGDDGNDRLQGGAGNDHLDGGAGDDIYRFGRGDGNDTIYDADYIDRYSVSHRDSLLFESGLSAADLVYQRSGDDLVFYIKDSGDSVTVDDWFDGAWNQLQAVEFSDGDALDLAVVEEQAAETVLGGSGADRLHGSETGNILLGLGGDDRLYGGAGDDTYRYAVGDGNDVINDTGGNDVLEFGAGIILDDLVVMRDSMSLYLDVPGVRQEDSMGEIRVDKWFDVDGMVRESSIETFSFADGTQLTLEELLETKQTHTATQAADLLYGKEADDVLDALGGDDFVSTGSGNDTLFGGEGNDTLYGGTGDDILIGGAGNDQLMGGNGSDTYRFSLGWGSDTVLSHAPNDVYTSDMIVFGDGISPSEIDTLNYDGTLVLQRGNSNDTIEVKGYFGAEGSRDYPIESILFSDGAEWSVSDVKARYLRTYPSDGDETIFGFASPDVIEGRSGDDTLFGYDGDDTLHGDGGDDTLFGSNGADRLLGRLGSDTLFGDDGADRLLGGLGSDTLFGGKGVDTLHGDADNDTLFGENGDDIIFGDDGADELYGGYGNDEMIGGNGHDNLYGGIGNDKLTGEEGDDALYGGGDDNILHGGVGDDQLYGEGQRNELDGEEGNDILYGGGDENVLHGGVGHDELYGGGQRNELDGEEGNDILYGGGDDNILHGGVGDDQLYGGGQRNELDGGEGNDILYAGSDNDILKGGVGDDELHGGGSLFAGRGDDQLYGGSLLQGGAGSDTYHSSLGGRSVHIDNGTDNSADSLDTLIFGNVDPDQVTVTRDIDDLVFGIINSNGSVTVNNWFQGEAHRLDRIKIDDALLMGDSLGELDSNIHTIGVNEAGELVLI